MKKDSEKPSFQSKQARRHHPEFIVLDEKNYRFVNDAMDEETEEEPDTPFAEFLNIHWSVRILSCVAFCLAFVCFMLAALFTIWAAALVVFTLGFNKKAKAIFWKAKRFLNNTTVITLGFVIAVFSPPLGFGLMVIYFTMNGDYESRERLGKIINLQRYEEEDFR